MACRSTPYKHLYDTYDRYSFFGGMEQFFYEPLDADMRARMISNGYIVNKDINEVLW